MAEGSPTPRRRNAASTKARILEAACKCFAQVGYAGTGIRDIAAAAGVSYTLLGRYYGSKAGLLEAALIESTGIGPIMITERSRFGGHLAELIARNVPDGQQTAMTILAAADPVAKEIAMRVVEERVVQPLAAWIGEPHARERALAIMVLGGGFVTYSQHMPLLAGPVGPDHVMVQWLARSFQQILDEPETWQTVALPEQA
jgi:AcrR family transcriptional regulator